MNYIQLLNSELNLLFDKYLNNYKTYITLSILGLSLVSFTLYLYGTNYTKRFSVVKPIQGYTWKTYILSRDILNKEVKYRIKLPKKLLTNNSQVYLLKNSFVSIEENCINSTNNIFIHSSGKQLIKLDINKLQKSGCLVSTKHNPILYIKNIG